MSLPPKIFDSLCEEDESLTLANALKKAMLKETKINQSHASDESEVMYVKSHGRQQHGKGARGNNNSKSSNSNTKSNGNGNQKKAACIHCGWKNHASGSCKYKSSTCHSCGQIGHIKNLCSKNDKNSVKFIENNIRSNNLNDDSNIFLYSFYSIHDGIQTDGTTDFDLTLCNIDRTESVQVVVGSERSGHGN